MTRLDPTETCYVLGRVGKKSRNKWFRRVADLVSGHDDLVKVFDKEFLGRLKTATQAMLQAVRADLCVELQTNPSFHKKLAEYNDQVALAQGVLCKLKTVAASTPTFSDRTAGLEVAAVIKLTINGCKARMENSHVNQENNQEAEDSSGD